MLATYRLHQRETSLKMRQVFMAGPDDEQLEAPTFLRGDPRQCLEVWSCLPLRRMAESSAGDFTAGKIQKTRGQRVAKMYGQQKRNMIHTSSTAYEQDHSAAAHNPRARRPGGGSCCNLMDCRPTQSRMVGDHYEVKPHGGCWKCEDSAGETNGRSRYSSRNVRRSLGITPCADADCPRSLAHLAAR